MSFSEPVLMTGLINITQEISAAGAVLKKISGDDGSNATATSLEYIESLQSARRGVKWTVPKGRGSRFCLGLTSATSFPQDPQQEAKLRESCDKSSISHFARIDDDGDFFVECAQFGKVKTGDVIEVRLSAEPIPKIQYRRNGELVYISTKETPLQLCAKICAWRQEGPLVEGLQWIFEPGYDVEREGEVALADLHGIVRNPFTRALSRRQYIAGNARVHSKDAINDIRSERVGTSFVISEGEPGSDQKCAVGITSDPEQGSSSLESLDHAIHFRGGSLKVFAKGVMQGEIHHHVKAGDRIDMILALDDESSQPKMQYYVNRQLLAETHSEVHFPLYVKVCAMSPGKLIEDLRWIDRSQLQVPCLRHISSPSSGLADDTHVEKATLEAKLEEMKAVTLGQAQLHEEISALKTEVGSLKQKAAEEQAQLREEARVEKQHLEVQLKEMKVVVEVLQADVAQQQKEIKAGSDALLAVTKEKAQLLLQMEDQREATRIASDAKVHMQEENDALRGAIDSLEEQLRMEKAASRAAVDGKKALQVSIDKQKEEIKAGSAALLALTRENAHLKVQLEGEKVRSGAITEEKVQLQSEITALRSATNEQEQLQEQLKAEKAASCAEASEKVQYQICARQLQAENRELHKVTQEMIEDKVRLEMQEQLLQAEIQELRRQLLQSKEPSVISGTDNYEECTIAFATVTGGSIE